MDNGAYTGTVTTGQAAWLGDLEAACPKITDCDFDGVRAMYRSAIQRALHDACGAVVSAPSQVEQMRFAREAWNFLHSHKPEFRNERWLVCELAGVDPEALERRMKQAEIPEPTVETLKHAWSILELAYWNLGGQVGERPAPREPNSKPEKRQRNDGRRLAKGYRFTIVPRRSERPLGGDRGTFLFNPNRVPGVPVRAKQATGARMAQAIMSHQLAFGF